MTADLSFAEVRRAVIAALERAADTLQRLPIPRNGRRRWNSRRGKPS